MKAVQVMLDERLLAELDRDQAVQESGRSAVIREAVANWLGSRRRALVDEAFRKGYGAGGGLGQDWSGWQEEGEWPDD